MVTVPSRRDWPEYACPDEGPSSHTGGSPQAPPATQKFKIIIIIIQGADDKLGQIIWKHSNQ
jgi:hypothetical protein